MLEMEQRAKERKDRREQLRQAYEEKQRKADEERRQAEARREDERKKVVLQEKEAKKALKSEELRRKEQERAELEREKARIHEARQYYKRGLMIKYGIIPLLKNVETEKEELKKAQAQNLKWILRNGLGYLKLAMSEIKLEAKRRDDRMMYVAIRFHERNLLRNAFEGIYQLLESLRDTEHSSRRHYLLRLLSRHLAHWKVAVPLIREERRSVQAKENLLVRKFRMVRFTQLTVLADEDGPAGAAGHARCDERGAHRVRERALQAAHVVQGQQLARRLRPLRGALFQGCRQTQGCHHRLRWRG